MCTGWSATFAMQGPHASPAPATYCLAQEISSDPLSLPLPVQHTAQGQLASLSGRALLGAWYRTRVQTTVVRGKLPIGRKGALGSVARLLWGPAASSSWGCHRVTPAGSLQPPRPTRRRLFIRGSLFLILEREPIRQAWLGQSPAPPLLLYPRQDLRSSTLCSPPLHPDSQFWLCWGGSHGDFHQSLGLPDAPLPGQVETQNQDVLRSHCHGHLHPQGAAG